MKLGILGGGQLGRMLALAAQPLGLRVLTLDPSLDAPARAVAEHIPAEYDDPRALDRLAEADVVTFEFENIPEISASRLSERVPVYPPPRALLTSQDRFVEKSTFRELGIATPEFRRVDSPKDLEEAFAELGPLVLKTRRFGYDGKGQRVVRDRSDLKNCHESLGGAPAIAEKWIDFRRELSVILARGVDGQIAEYPIFENTHHGGILRRTIAPAPHLPAVLEAEARGFARKLAEHLAYVGVITLELFDTGNGLLANEFAPRVHNSGHLTIEGCRTSQFENHVRAVLGLPLGDTSSLELCAMVNCIGSMPRREDVLSVTDVHYHDYGKEPRHGRKVGHLTVRAGDLGTLMQRVERLESLLPSEPGG